MKRFKCYRQLEQSDCGLTCIRMIANHYGLKIPVSILRDTMETTKLGVSLNDLIVGFSRIGMDSAAVKISENALKHMPLPAIIYWRQEHFVVLYKIDTRNRFFIADPAEGSLKINEEDFLEYWKGTSETGIAVIAEPGENFDTSAFSSERKLHSLWKTVITELFSHKRMFITIILLSLLCMVFDLLSPILLQSTVDKGIEGKNIHLVWMIVASQLAVFIGYAVSSNIIQYIVARLSLNLNLEMLRKYLVKLLDFPMSFFDRKASADLIQKLDDQGRIKNYVMQLPNSTFLVMLNLTVFSSLMIVYNKWLFLFFLVMTLGEIGWSTIFLKSRRRLDYSLFAESAVSRNSEYEIINGIVEVKSCGAQKSLLSNWEKIQHKILKFSLKSQILSMYMSGGQSLIARIKEVAITGICATLIIKGRMSFGEMLTISYLVGRLSGPFHNIIGMMSQTQDAMISNERLDEIMNNDTDHQGKDTPDDFTITMKNVCFRYPGISNPFVIEDLSLSITPGTTTAIVGESGCGKTTLIKLMLGFYEPQKGRLELGGIEVSELNRDKWLENCGAVMQSGYIFSDTIEANIARGDEEIDLFKVVEAANVAGLSDFIDSLPMKYKTRIGSSGVELSGGQKQRLLIARAIYKNPDLLFLDEATSSLDAVNEKVISDKIQAIQAGKTLIIAAHRLSTVRNADRILYMEKGRIVEDGTHEQLIELKGRYYNLVSNQLELSI